MFTGSGEGEGSPLRQEGHVYRSASEMDPPSARRAMFIGSGEGEGSPLRQEGMFIERVYHSPTDIALLTEGAPGSSAPL